MSDELDNLTDDKLSETFAVEVAGMKPYRDGFWHSAPPLRSIVQLPAFATSADAVIPWLSIWSQHHNQGGEPEYFSFHSPPPVDGGLWNCDHMWDHHDGAIPCGPGALAPTFARAACLALIRANRAQKVSSCEHDTNGDGDCQHCCDTPLGCPVRHEKTKEA